jgi:hypothetical protein
MKSGPDTLIACFSPRVDLHRLNEALVLNAILDVQYGGVWIVPIHVPFVFSAVGIFINSTTCIELRNGMEDSINEVLYGRWELKFIQVTTELHAHGVSWHYRTLPIVRRRAALNQIL